MKVLMPIGLFTVMLAVNAVVLKFAAAIGPGFASTITKPRWSGLSS
jgi:hypothetical protein